ncbi:polysaccharide biosynthesis tyrosine autokinase [Desulfococcaceae bacterium HSG9]|nr:polysaccharide biosynthesis tyrosine autokinase [Desulfococcaceae bacterium HSG9]
MATLFVIITIIFFLRGLSYSPVYTASARLLLEKGERNPLGMNYAYGSYWDPKFLLTQSEIIKSTAVAKKAALSLNLEKTFKSFFSDQKEPFSIIQSSTKTIKSAGVAILKLFGIEKLRPPVVNISTLEYNKSKSGKKLKSEKYISLISHGIEVKPVENSSIITLSFTSPSPALAKMVVNAVTKAYIEVMLEIKVDASRRTLSWMTEKAEKEKIKLERAEKALQEYLQTNKIITIGDRITVIPRKLEELSSQLFHAEIKRKELEAVNNKVRQIKEDFENAETMKALTADETLQSIRMQILKSDQNITELSKKYGPKHPVLKRALAEKTSLERKKKQEIKRIIKSIENEYELALTKESNLRKLLEKTQKEAIYLNEKFVQYTILKREIDTNRSLYNALTKKINESRITDQAETVRIWVVEAAKKPRAPSNRRIKTISLIGVLLGLFSGIGLAFLLEYLDQTVKSADELEERLGVPLLGVSLLSKVKDKKVEKCIIEQDVPHFVENFNAIRTALLLSSTQSPPRCLLITSTLPSEGKTTVAINLAVTLANQTDKKVLLIDADLRKPSLAKVFGINNTHGLTTLLTSETDEFFGDCIRQGPIEDLQFITSGPHPPNPSELLGSKRMIALLNMMQKKFDFIVIDSPPVLSVTDSIVLSKIVGGTIFVIKAGKSTYELVNRGLKLLTTVQARVLGVVLNAVDVKKHTYYYDYYDYYDDSYKEESKRHAKHDKEQ